MSGEKYFLIRREASLQVENPPTYKLVRGYETKEEFLKGLRSEVAGYGDLTLIAAKQINFKVNIDIDK